MALSTTCPSCGARLAVTASHQGKKVRCKTCQQPFVVQDCRDDNGRIPDRAPRGAIAPEPDRPTVRVVDDREDYVEDRRRRRRSDPQKKTGVGTILLIVGGCLALLLLSVGIGVTVIVMKVRAKVVSLTTASAFQPPNVAEVPFPIDLGQPARDPDPINDAINRLKSRDVFTQSDACVVLERMEVNPQRRAEVVAALKGVLHDHRPFVPRDRAAQALTTWAAREDVPYLIELLDDNEGGVVNNAIITLGKLKDPRGAGPLANRLSNGGQRGMVSQALKDIGSPAEQAVLAQLNHNDNGVRIEACKIIKVIGTPASHEPLIELAQEEDQGVAEAARAALPEKLRPPVYGPKQTITLNVHIRNMQNWPELEKRIKALADSRRPICKVNTSGEYQWVKLTPVLCDAETFARKIDFGKVTAVHSDQRLIYVDTDR
jgi:predicted Zn finger-like uncharacterized protein